MKAIINLSRILELVAYKDFMGASKWKIDGALRLIWNLLKGGPDRM